jgi:hypothetical protein
MTRARELLERLETHRALRDASQGFHLSDDDIDILIEALRKLEDDHGA